MLKILESSRSLSLLKLSSAISLNYKRMTDAQHAAIGIDLGSYVSCIAVAKRGGIEIITNEANFRETPTLVGYGPGERLIGQPGNAKIKTNFRDTVTSPNRLLGLDYTYPKLKEEVKFIPARSSKGENGRLYFAINYQGNQEHLLPEQVTAGYLSKLRTIITLNKLVNTEAVLSVPSYYTQLQRQALLNAAKIAELNVTRLLNESTAVCLDYGIFRRNDLDAKNARNVLFLDFGHSKLSLFAASFTKDKATMLAQRHERHLGCRDIDYLLLQHYQKVFEKSSGGMDIFENRKSIVKLTEVIERQRKILSANIQHQLTVECLQEDSDLDYTMKREELEKLAEPVFNQIVQILTEFKAELDAKSIPLHSIEMVGGGTRIPAFQRLIQGVFKTDPMRTLNSSESISKGCALMAAIKSPLFRVAEYNVEQINYYPLRVYWNFVQTQPLGGNEKAYPEKQSNLLFPAGVILPVTKTLKFTRKEGIEMLLNYDPVVEGFNQQILYLQTPPQNPKEAEFSVVYKIGLNENGIVGLEECFLSEDTIEETKTAKPKAEGDAADKEPEYDVKTSKKTKQMPLKADIKRVEHLSTKDIATCFEVESKMVNQDKLLLETYERKNELESLIYNSKEKLGSSYKDYVNPTDTPAILQALEQSNNWLYSEGQHSTRGMYTQKLDLLKPLIEPIAKRYSAHEDLKNALSAAVQAVDSNTSFIKSQDPKYAHIAAEDRNPGGEQILKLQQLITSTANTMQSASKWENQKVTSNDVYKQINSVTEGVKKIMSKALPPPPAPPKAADPGKPAEGSTKMEEEEKKPEETEEKKPEEGMDIEK